jgi:CBS domain-containing protein
MGTLPTVEEFMQRFVDALSPEMSVGDAIDFLLEKRVSGAPVVNGSGKVVGILTEKDCLPLVAMGSGEVAEPEGNVRDFMVRDPKTIPPQMDIYYAAGLLMKANIGLFPVVAEGKLVGTITRVELIRAMHGAGLPCPHKEPAWRPYRCRIEALGTKQTRRLQ